jgi:hypothetical protein
MIGFRDQFKRCRKDGVAFDEKCICCGHEQIMCGFYGGHCMSSKCREARLNKENGEAFYRVTRTWVVRANKITDAVDAAKNWDHNQMMVEKLENVIPMPEEK